MIATKGYGLSVDDIDMSSPADMKPYIKAHEEELKEKDYLAWTQGKYFASALDCTVCNSELWRKKGSKPHNYIEKPIMQEIQEKQQENKPLTEEEKKRQTEQLFLRLRIMGANFNLNHNK